MVGQQNDFSFVFRVQNDNSSQEVKTKSVFLSIESAESNDLIPKHVSGNVYEVFLQDREVCNVLHVGDKENALLRSGGVYLVVIVPPGHGDKGSRGKGRSPESELTRMPGKKT
jgi:hypothetical protein